MRWRKLRAAVATDAARQESVEIVQRMKKAQIPVRFNLSSETTKGTRCVLVWVDEDRYEQAREIAQDLLPARPT